LIDSIVESPETVNLVLLGGNVGSSPSILTILDGTTVSPTPTPTPGTTTPPTPVANTYFFGAANYSVPEGSAASITVNRSGDLSVPGTITFSTGGGSAKSTGSEADYSSVFLTVNFAAGQSSAPVSVLTFPDAFFTEPTETVGLFLSGGSVASPSVALLRIIDTSPVPPLFFSYGSSTDPITDSGTGVVTINRTGGNPAVAASIDYVILDDGELLYTTDYTIINPSGVSNSSGGTVSFGSGQTTVNLTIQNTSGLLKGGDLTFGFGTGNIGSPPSAFITLI
jgi:hypothetical protein